MLGNTIASIKSSFGTKLGFFTNPLLITTGWFLILAKMFRNDYIAACSLAHRNATGKNELGGYVTVPCLSKTTQHNSTAYWLKF